MSTIKYRPDIDGLRAIAVSSVVAFHAFPELIGGGFIGVDIFFVISGFLISKILFEELDADRFSFLGFYARRVRRIFPALIVVMAFCLIFGWLVLLPEELNQLGKHIAAGAVFSSNFILWSEAGYFDVAAETKPLLHLWSLGIEEQFYIVWPLLLWLAWKSRFSILTLTCILTALSFLLNLETVQRDPIAAFYSPLTRFWELMSGSILAWLSLYKRDFVSQKVLIFDQWLCRLLGNRWAREDGVALPNLASFLGLFLLAYGFWRIEKGLEFPGAWAVIPALGAVLIIAAGPASWFNRVILSHKSVVWIGLISFPLYLWHWPILSFATIIKGEPHRDLRIAAVALSFLLAWLTVRFVERQFRFGGGVRPKVISLCGMMLAFGLVGVLLGNKDLSQSHRYERLLLSRENLDLAVGSSTTWFQGKGDWLFLGNTYNRTVEKLKLSINPDQASISAVTEAFARVAASGAENGTKVALIMGPDKSSVYPEFLPNGLVPSPVKYSSFFLDALRRIPNLTVYDPTNDLLSAKDTEGLLYWMTDTHWNAKGAYLAFLGFSKLLDLPAADVDFVPGEVHRGDLIDISGLENFPLHSADNWSVVWKHRPTITSLEMEGERQTTFGTVAVVNNDSPVSPKYVWVIGDSFTGGLRQYFNATFAEVHYVGHWSEKLESLPEMLESATRKPDLVVIVRVERSF